MAGYGAKTTGITENTTGMGDQVLKVATAGAVVHSQGAQEVTVGANGQDFNCKVDVKAMAASLADLTGSTDYKCTNPSNPQQTFKATVKHGPTGPK